MFRHHLYLVWPHLAASRARTHQGTHTSWVNWSPHLEDSNLQLFHSGGVSSMCQIQTPIWSQTCSVEFMSGLRAGQSMTSTSFCAKKAIVSQVVWGMVLSWTYINIRPKNVHRPGKHTIEETPDVTLVSIHHHQITPLMVGLSGDGYGQCVGRIYLSLSLHMVHTNMTIIVK